MRAEESLGTSKSDRRRRPRCAPGFRPKRGKKLVEGLTRTEIVSRYETKVRYIATRLATNLPTSVDLEDLVSVGFIGLMDAADKFNASRGVKFATYAEFRIRGAILDELRNQDWVPHCARGRAKSIEKAANDIERVTGQRPSDTELSTKLGLTRERLQKMRDHLGALTLVSLDATEYDSTPIATEDREDANPFENAARNDTRDYLENLFQTLPEDERIVLSCYYFRSLNLREISQILGVTESRISQLHTQAILKLRQQLSQDSQCPRSVFLMLLAA